MRKQKKTFGWKLILVLCGTLLCLFSHPAHAELADFAGVYAGTYTAEDDDTGIFRCIVETDGSGIFLLWSTTDNSGDRLILTIDENGNFSGTSVFWRVALAGAIDDPGHMSGTGSSETQDTFWLFSGQLVTEQSIRRYVGDYSGRVPGFGEKSEWSFTLPAEGYIFSDETLAGAMGPDGKAVSMDNNIFTYLEIHLNGVVTGNVKDNDNDWKWTLIGSRNDIDNDHDGFTEDQGDCNDDNIAIYPGAPESCGDEIDQDCDGSDLPCAFDDDDSGGDSDDGGGDGTDDSGGDSDDGGNDGTDDSGGDSDDSGDDGTDDSGGDSDDDGNDNNDDGDDDDGQSSPSAGCFIRAALKI